MRIGLVGVPYNSSGTVDGVALAPAALRTRGLVEALRAIADVDDRGDISIAPGGPARDPVSAIIAAGTAAAMSKAVSAAVRSVLDDGRLPLVIGGDCPILFGCLAGAMSASRQVGLLYLDGHEDAYPPTASTTGELADMDLGLLLGHNREGLPLFLNAAIPTIAPREVAILGARDSTDIAAVGVSSLRDEVAYFVDDVTLSGSSDAVMRAALRHLGPAKLPWLHVDLDVLSTTALAAIDYPQTGGLDWSALEIACIEAFRSPPGPLGWDVTIYNPELDPSGVGANRIISFVADVLGGVTGS